ncbi:hypothetical protein [Limosilactobacillus fastidiosus]|uniref:hypothetical protein n=1 Tax=Limosilactobacillus fastidiosus TaxID=2759855 RepID=UPI001E5AF6E7|nr:hypothetical protein [Limosilactobacillus fastidiosus]MCD7084080.1 hypothetical protein [Limosilactobacillus fastidiosus]
MDVKVTDKYIKEELPYLSLENKDFNSVEFNSGVYNSVLNIKIMNEDSNEKILASARCFMVNGEVTNIVDAADSESGDLFLVADVMVKILKLIKKVQLLSLMITIYFLQKLQLKVRSLYLRGVYYPTLKIEKSIM